MSYIPGSKVQSPIISNLQPNEIDDDGPMETIDIAGQNTRPGVGGLAGRNISVGDGKQREETISLGEKNKGFFSQVGKSIAMGIMKALGGGVRLLGAAITFIPRMINDKILEPRTEKSFRKENSDLVKALGTPKENSVLEKHGVTQKLMDHAQRTGTKMSEAEIKELVAIGENIAKGLYEEGGDKIPLVIEIDGKQHVVESNTLTARALSWFMMAQCANNDVERARLGDKSGVSDMVTEGSITMKDPGNRMYNFLNNAPTSCSRMSTHFTERTGHEEKHKVMGLFQMDKPSQRGIEDYQNKMPGKGGTILYDKLKNEEMFVKFEHGGCPPFFQTEKGQGIGNGICRFFSALDRNLGHALSFLNSRGAGSGTQGEITRQEHVFKGVLNKDEEKDGVKVRDSLNKGFMKLVGSAFNEGIIDGNVKDIGKSVHKLGMPYVHDAIATIRESNDQLLEQARDTGDKELEQRCLALRQQCSDLSEIVGEEMGKYGFMDKGGYDRRGGEVRIQVH